MSAAEDKVDDAWSKLASLPDNRWFANGGMAEDGTIFLTGGFVNGNITNTVLSYKRGHVQWKIEPSHMGTDRAYHGCVVYKNSLHVFGGDDSTRHATHSGERLDLYEAMGGWTNLGVGNYNRSRLGVERVGKMIYVFGGIKSGRNESGRNESGRNSKAMDTFNIDNNDWEGFETMAIPSAQCGFGSTVVGNKIYVVGGEGENSTTVSTVWSFDTSSNEWEMLRSMKISRAYCAVVSVGEFVVVMGGTDALPSSNGNWLSSIEVYDIKQQKWAYSSIVLSEPTAGAFAVVIPKGDGGHEIVVIGGQEKNKVEAVDFENVLLPSEFGRLESAPAFLDGDHSTGEDLLNIKIIANVFANHLASTNLDPPFVLGILGKWGSGKSYFFNLIKQRLIEIQKETKLDTKNTNQFVGHMYCIKFDCWTFSKTDLWASLMYWIFRELSKQLDLESIMKEVKNSSIIELCDNLSGNEREYLKKMEDDTGSIDLLEKVQKALRGDGVSAALSNVFNDHRVGDRKELKLAQKELEDLTNTSVWEQALKDDGSKKKIFNAMQKAVIDKMKKEVDEKQKESKEMNLQENFQGLSFLTRGWVSLKSAPLLSQLMLGIFVCILVGASVFLKYVFSGNKFDDFNRWAITLGGFVATVAAAFAPLSQFLKGTNEKLNEFREEFSSEIKQAQALVSDIEANQTNDQTDEIIKRQDKISEIRKRLTILEGASMQSVVKNRVENDVYTQKLGTVHQAQMDLEALSEAMFKRYYKDSKPRPKETKLLEETKPILKRLYDYFTNNDTKKDEPDPEKDTMFPRGKPRIILFIDDLDRCAPDNVIEVLEAIQLLVKTRLFVVVVAIDSRYVCLSLENKKYKDILHRKRSPTGMDFMAKIIQIPFCLPSISDQAMKHYVRKQITVADAGDIISSSGVENSPVVSPDDRQVNNSDDGNGGNNGENAEGSNNDTVEAVEDDDVEGRNNRGENTVTTAGANQLRIRGYEGEKFTVVQAELLETACTTFKLVPRSVKMVINTYKLLTTIYKEDRGQKHLSDELSIFLLVMASSEITRDGVQRIYAAMERKKKPSEWKTLYDMVEKYCPDLGDYLGDDQLGVIKKAFEKCNINGNDKWVSVCNLSQLVRCFGFLGILEDDNNFDLSFVSCIT